MLGIEWFKTDELFSKHTRIGVLGNSGTGKTYFLKRIIEESIIYGNNHGLNNEDGGFFDYMFYYTGGAEAETCDLSKYIHENHMIHISKDNADDNIKALIKWVQETYEKSQYKSGKRPRHLIIFDDFGQCLNNNMNGFTNIARHYNVWVVFLLHRALQLDTTTRSSLTHYVLTCNMRNETDLKVWQRYFYKIPEEKYYTVIDPSKSYPLQLAREYELRNKYILNTQYGMDRDNYIETLINPETAFITKKSEHRDVLSIISKRIKEECI